MIIPGGSIYTLNFESHFQPGELQILPGVSPTATGSARLRIVRKSASGVVKEEDIQIEGSNWQIYPLIPERGGSLALINLEPSKPFFLAGLKFGGQQNHKYLWPWQGVTEVSVDDKQRQIQRAAFLPGKKKIRGVTYDLEVLQDAGSTVLWRLRPEKGE